uniref:Putative juvenile hormone n=1 Tax=Panstrongylus lignarius TaxID=156445 RepID=A0A224XSM8_9HEMI
MIKVFWGCLFCFFFVICKGTTLERQIGNEVFLGIKDDNNTITDETIRKLFEKLKEIIGHDLGFKEQKISTNSSAMFWKFNC